MRIAHFSDVFFPNINGLAVSVLNNSKEMALRGHSILVCTSKIRGDFKDDFGKNILVERFPSIRLKRASYFYQFAVPNPIAIFKKLDKFKPDIIHIHTPSLIGFCGLLYGKRNKIPVVHTYHYIAELGAYYLPLNIVLNNPLTRLLIRKYSRMFNSWCNLLISPSKAIRRYILKTKVRTPVKVVSNGVDLNLFYPRKVKKNANTLLYVGRVTYEKNVDMMLNAFRIAAERLPNIKLKIVGPGPNIDKLKRYAELNGIGKRVIFSGTVLQKNLPEVYSEAAALIITSKSETEGLVVLEAMACGLPVICVDYLALHDIVNSKNGCVAKSDDTKSISDCIIRVMSSDKLRKSLSSNAIKTVKSYSLSKCIDKIEDIYKRLSNF